MAKKILLNILLNIAIFVLILWLFWAFNHQMYAYGAISLLTLAMLIFLKIRLIKAVRRITRKP